MLKVLFCFSTNLKYDFHKISQSVDGVSLKSSDREECVSPIISTHIGVIFIALETQILRSYQYFKMRYRTRQNSLNSRSIKRFFGKAERVVAVVTLYLRLLQPHTHSHSEAQSPLGLSPH